MMPRGGETSMLRCCWRAAFCVRNPYSPIWSQSRRRKMARIQRQKNDANRERRRRPSCLVLPGGIVNGEPKCELERLLQSDHRVIGANQIAKSDSYFTR